MENTKQIKEYLIQNPVDRSIPNCYKNAADLFGVTTERIRSIYKRLRKAGLVESNEPSAPSVNYYAVDTGGVSPDSYRFTTTANTATITTTTPSAITTLEELIQVCNIDILEWDIYSWECRSSNGRFYVSAKLRAKKVDTDTVKQKEVILKELYGASPVVRGYNIKEVGLLGESHVFSTVHRDKLLEISVPDVHFGKLSHREETGEDYDIKVAEERFVNAVKDLVSRVKFSEVERILFPVGNDLINFDNKYSTTTNGTPQDSDSRFHKVIRTVKRVLIQTIDYLSGFAPVDVVMVAGNHDETVTFTIGEILDAYYYNNEFVTIDNQPKLRKYYQFGKVGMQFTHGDKEPHETLGLIFATEQPNLWGDTRFRFCQLGHYHKNKKLNYVSVDEFQGFEIQILPSLSATDAWHYGKGYNSKKAAKAFLFDKEVGKIAEYTHSI